MWMLGIELMCGRAVGAFNCRPISAVLSCYAGHAFLRVGVGGYCYQQNSALKTFVGGVIPVDM